ncbi:MAG: hypothetical protein UV35_C0046G0002 [candidate division WWE3 bacterium GW2011_GWB1_42_6]|uniref:Uncharacterized protein n=1 Tax=candidate division WWE3 bacterium GW2011_GWB1_42_6 TaxID=1619115 RepID=A0A0G1AW51_UNCKA|nr:MAG: hypothetical protein UV35_C0046G0002 [candidate division WWE3 bacterium GW2011_GWB1_42_6]
MHETMYGAQENAEFLNNPEVKKIAQEAEKLNQHLEYIPWLDKENKHRFLSEVMGARPDVVERQMGAPIDIYYDREENICIYCEDVELESGSLGMTYWKKATVAYGDTDSQNFLDKTGVDPKLVYLSAAVAPIEYYYKLLDQSASDKMKLANVRFTVSRKDTLEVLNTSGGGPDVIQIETKYYENFFKNALNGSVEEFKDDYDVTEAKFFHEYVHILNYEYINDSKEEYTQMAEFLWNPTTNIFKQHFNMMKDRLSKNVINDNTDAVSEIYDDPFIKVTSKILLNELYDRGSIGKLDTKEKVLEVYRDLDKYYAQIDKEERIQILSKYLKINIGSLKDEINNITEKLSLPY